MKSVTDVDDKGLRARMNREPLVIDVDFQAADLILMENGDTGWVTVRASAHGEVGAVTGWV